MSSHDTLLKDRLHPLNLKHNNDAITYCRILLGILTGLVCGVLGITGWLAGFTTYLLTSQLITLAIYYRYRNDWPSYFQNVWSLVLDGVSSGSMSFLMFWTLMYNIVHVYH